MHPRQHAPSTTCTFDNEALKLIDEALQRPPGGNNNQHGYKGKPEAINLDNIQDDSVKAPTGTSRAAAIRRLRKDRPDNQKINGFYFYGTQ